MKRRIPFEYAILGLAAAAAAVVALPAHAQSAAGSAADRIARGKYLVSTSGCHDCHTPWKMGEKGPEPDMTRALSGHPEGMALPPPPKAEGPWLMTATASNTAWAGPWGISFTANLTPDPETGLGKWTQRNFTETIRTGRHMGRGRQVLPPMPIPVYRNFTDADLEAIFGYLQSLPAIRNRVPEPLPPAASMASK
ncbi:MAG TPA: diheme cytochrome c-553 [Burkholderiaceae bacterium]|nr:diheme cytochrome c-553 [Burkholderiaceae bacterium]